VLPAWAARAVTKLVEARVQQGARSGDYLFISFRGRGGRVPTDRPISPDGIYQLFKRYCAAVGAEHASPHSARATAITKLLADGVSFREVQEFSRHSSVQMVEVYDKRRIAVDENPGRTLDYK
jgi:integrase